MDVLSNKAENGLMTWEQLLALGKVYDRDCISIYLPTSRSGESVDSGEGKSD
jgi:hypothetical protein